MSPPAAEVFGPPFWEEPVPVNLPEKKPIKGVEDISETECLVRPREQRSVLAIVDGIVYYNTPAHRGKK